MRLNMKSSTRGIDGNAQEIGWKWLIQRAKTKLRSARLRVAQLEGLISDFERKHAAGEPTPSEIAAKGAQSATRNAPTTNRSR